MVDSTYCIEIFHLLTDTPENGKRTKFDCKGTKAAVVMYQKCIHLY